jgi:uncharacterized membrane protein YqhA
MPASKKRPKPVVEEIEIKSFNPLKSKVGKFIILVLAIGFFLGILVAAIAGIVSDFG